MKKKIFSLLIIFILVFTFFASAFAATINDLQSKKNETQKELNNVNSELSEEMKEIKILNQSISDNEDKIEELNIQVTALENEISQKQEQYDLQKEQLEQRLVANYKFGGASYLDVLLNSSDFTSFISNYYYISKIAKSDKELLEEIENKKNEIEQSKKELESKQQEYEQILQTLKSDKAKKDTYVSQLSSEQKSLQQKIDEYDKEIKKIEEQARQASISSSKNNSSFVGGTMLWPCPSSRYITSYFGGRNTGIPGASTNHKGIDIGASSGAAIVSVLDGTVIKSAYSSARGNYLMVDHGGGIITLYQHGKDGTKRVSVGQKVTKGQTIMGVGCTGVGSGNHLHFEVWKNGVPQNPLQSQYLGSY